MHICPLLEGTCLSLNFQSGRAARDPVNLFGNVQRGRNLYDTTAQALWQTAQSLRQPTLYDNRQPSPAPQGL